MSGVDCCSERGVPVNCLGNCEPEERTAHSDPNYYRSNKCQQYEKIINECNPGSVEGKYN